MQASTNQPRITERSPALSEFVGRSDAAKYLGLTTSTLAHWAKTQPNKPPFRKFANRVIYKISDLDAFLAEMLGSQSQAEQSS